MPPEYFEAEVRRTADGSAIGLKGTVNRAAKERMEAAYGEATRIDGEIVLDFTEADYINSTGIALIVGILSKARAEERDVGALGLTPHYREVFEITRLSDFMTIYDEASTG